jgi:PAS domain-containing protein
MSVNKPQILIVVADCPDLIIMDIRLDGPIDGIETARRVKDICPVPVIYLTADCNEATLEQAKNTEAYGYILKPFEERALRASLEIALARGRKDLENKGEHEWNEIILKNLEDGIIAADPSGIVTRVNDKALDMLARSRTDCVGANFAELVRVLDGKTGAPETLSLTQTIIDNEAKEKSDCLLAVDQKTTLPIKYRLAPLRNKNNNTIGAILFLTLKK